MTNLGPHYHCDVEPYENSCKYGDLDCPALATNLEHLAMLHELDEEE